MFKGWTRWLIRSIVSVLFISSVTVFTTWKMTEWHMKQYVARLDLPEHVERMEVGEILALIGDADGTSKDERTPIERITQGSEPPSASRSLEEHDDAAGEEQDGTSADEAVVDEELSSEQEVDQAEADDAVLPDAVPVFGTELVVEEDQMLQEFAMSTEQFLTMQDQLSTEEKAEIFAILFAKVPQHEFQNLSYILEDGITTEESIEIARILQQYLTEEELQELSNILQKYE